MTPKTCSTCGFWRERERFKWDEDLERLVSALVCGLKPWEEKEPTDSCGSWENLEELCGVE